MKIVQAKKPNIFWLRNNKNLVHKILVTTNLLFIFSCATIAQTNTQYGTDALKSITSGAGNAAFGYQALYSNTDGLRNTANGHQALYSNTDGGGNTANGHQALYSNTDGGGNTANGNRALYSNTTGDYNTANGSHALYSNTTGSSNTANGLGALFSNTTGSYNTANGSDALYSNMGWYNTANGFQALYSNTSGFCNTANGFQALYSNTTGDNNTMYGYKAGYSITTGYGNTIIGANITGLPADLSNTIILADGNGSQKLYINSSGNMGIGTTNPTHKLSVNGAIRAKEILVDAGWSDFVFDDHYKLRSLTEVEQFVKLNKHLPEIPSQKEVEKNGVQLGDISSKLLMKIEELTLYMIEMKKEIQTLQKENTALKTIISNPKN